MKNLSDTLFGAAKFVVVCVFLLILSGISSAQNPSPCQPPEIDAAVYDFVPETQLQTGDFRPLMKTETAFLQKLRKAENLNVTDYTTPILPPEIMPDAPRISDDLQPPPAQIQEPYFFVGQITKTASGFLLDVKLKKSADGALLDDVKTPFASAETAETAGNTTATAMLAFFASQAQTARDNRETSDHAIDPHIDLIIDKLQIKPNETSPVKIVLSDCDGVRLKHRTIEAFLQLAHGSTPVQEDTLVRQTDDKGERNGIIGAKAPGVITYIAKFKYKDVLGIPRERTDTKTVVISGGEGGLWQMRADILYERSTLYFSTDIQSGKWSGTRDFIHKKASLVFVFKTDDTDPSGEIATDEVKNYNGFGEVFFRRKSIEAQASAEVRMASGLLDQSQAASEMLKAGFNISPANNEFQVSLNGVEFGGTEELFAVRKNPYNYVHRTGIEYREGMGAGGGATITPQMKKSGVYTFSKYDRQIINTTDGNGVISKGSTKGYELTKYDFEVRRISPGGTGIIKR